MVGTRLDFAGINRAAIGQLQSLLAEWLPDGKLNGKEWFARNQMRDDRNANSFSINIYSGVWHDFSSGDKGGDPISLYAFLFCGGDNLEAAKQLADRFGIMPLPDTKKPKADWVNAPVPTDPPKPPAEHFYRGKPDAIYPYFSQDFTVLGYVCRFTNSEGGKETIPLTWCQERATGREGWHWKTWLEPRPLYGLNRLSEKPGGATVLLVEGEKCADAAAAELPILACLSWPGGSKAVAKADWRPLQGRKVILWPDCDGLADKEGVVLPEEAQPGIQAMRKIAAKLLSLGCRLFWVTIPKPGEKPSGWDVADAVAEGLAGEALSAWLCDKARPYEVDSPKNAPRNSTPPPGDKRADLDAIIDKTDDFDELTVTLAALVKATRLNKAAREYLLNKIAKKARVPKWSLGDSAPESGGGDDDGGGVTEQVDGLNNRHAIVPLGGRILILNRDYDPVLKKNYFSFSSRADFELRYCNQKVWQTGEFKGIGQVWVDHPRRAQYEGMCFQPGSGSNGFVNLWQGWGVEPSDGQCHLFLEFLGATICNGDELLFDYVLRWCAHLVQKPHELPETALVLRGKEGAGKNRFASVLGQIVGAEHYLLLTSMAQVTGRFSGHLANGLLVFCNEAVWGGDKSAQGVLKSMITDPVQPVEFKGRDISMVANYKRVLMASNEDWVVPRGANDRHYVIIDVSDGRVGDFPYWQALTDEINKGCAAAFMNYLLTIDLTDWHPRQLPDRLKLRGWDLKIRGGGSVVQWWFEVLENGYLVHEKQEYSGNEDFMWPDKMLSQELRNHYLAWATRNKIHHFENATTLGKQLAKWGVSARLRRVDGYQIPKHHYILPPLAEARAVFSQAYGIPAKVFSDIESEVDIYDAD